MEKRVLKQLNYDIKKIIDTHTELSVRYIKEIPIEIYGNFKIIDNEGISQGDFDIRVLLPNEYPNGFPRLIETSKKIERVSDRHIDKDGNCCVEITQEILRITAVGITLQEFFKRYVYKFLCWQLIYEAEGSKKLKQWDHGHKGVVHFYCELLRCTNYNIIRKFIEAVLKNDIPARKDQCLCGSGRQTRKCHGSNFYDLQKIGNVQLINDLKFFFPKN